jgi:hypothetical protein
MSTPSRSVSSGPGALGAYWGKVVAGSLRTDDFADHEGEGAGEGRARPRGNASDARLAIRRRHNETEHITEFYAPQAEVAPAIYRECSGGCYRRQWRGQGVDRRGAHAVWR